MVFCVSGGMMRSSHSSSSLDIKNEDKEDDENSSLNDKSDDERRDGKLARRSRYTHICTHTHTHTHTHRVNGHRALTHKRTLSHTHTHTCSYTLTTFLGPKSLTH